MGFGMGLLQKIQHLRHHYFQVCQEQQNRAQVPKQLERSLQLLRTTAQDENQKVSRNDIFHYKQRRPRLGGFDLNVSLRSAIKSRWYTMIQAHLSLDFAYDQSLYQSLIRMVSSNVDLSSTVDTRNMLPIFALLAKHIQESEELKSHLKSLLSIGLKNGLKVINSMESTKKYVTEMQRILEFDFVPNDEIYTMCFRILQGLANKSNTDEFFALAHSVMQHMTMSKSTLDLQSYVDNESNGVSTFLVENAEKYDLKLKVPIFVQENQSK